MAVVDRFLVQLGPNLGGRWSLLAGGRCSAVVIGIDLTVYKMQIYVNKL